MGKKNQGYLMRQEAIRRIREDSIRAHSRTFTLDIVTLTLAEMGFTPVDMVCFRDAYMQMEEAYIDEIMQDFYGNHDKKIEVAKAHIDKLLKECVPPEMFIPYDERYAHG